MRSIALRYELAGNETSDSALSLVHHYDVRVAFQSLKPRNGHSRMEEK